MEYLVSLTVNGELISHKLESRTLLIDLLRDTLFLTGTHRGCDTAQCGACTVLVNGHAVKSCNVLVAQVDGSQVTTIDGLASKGNGMHPMQIAFRECHGLQCGFCTPGMVMSAIDLVNKGSAECEDSIREQLDGNICRCTGYENIVKAVAMAAGMMKG